jgi:hypothetical protein
LSNGISKKAWARRAKEATQQLDAIAPRGYKEATLDINKAVWQPSMQTQYDALVENGTWEIVEPETVKKARQDGYEVYIITSVWKYRIKVENGVIVKYKSRLCANGMWMKCDPKDTFSPTANRSTNLLMCAMAASFNCTLYAGDIPAAYLKAEINPKMKIFMYQPKGFVKVGKERSLCLLKKSLYGLPPAGKLWYEKLARFLISLGFERSDQDPSLFSLWSNDELMCFAITVDDFLMFSTCDILRVKIVDKLKEKFDYEDKGPATWFLGMAISQTDDFIELDQQQAIQAIVDKWPEARIADTPYLKNLYLKARTDDEEEALADIPSLTGELRYTTMTRPEILLALNQVCQFQTNPSMKHQAAVMRIIGFYKKNPYVPLRFKKNKNPQRPRDIIFELSGTSDSSLGNAPKGKSYYGYHTYVNGMMTVAKAKKTNYTIPDSTPYAEYIAMHESSKGMDMQKNLLESIGLKYKEPSTLWTDNKGSIKMATRDAMTPKSHAICLKYHSLRHDHKKGKILPDHVSDEENETDLYTKPVGRIKFWKCVAKGRGYDIDDYGVWTRSKAQRIYEMK